MTPTYDRKARSGPHRASDEPSRPRRPRMSLLDACVIRNDVRRGYIEYSPEEIAQAEELLGQHIVPGRHRG